MIVRIWQGIVLLANAEKYQEFLNAKVIPIYQRAEGNLGIYLCGEAKDQLVNFADPLQDQHRLHFPRNKEQFKINFRQRRIICSLESSNGQELSSAVCFCLPSY